MEPSHIGGLRLTPLAAAGGGADFSIVTHILPDFMQPQQQDNWCWAAVGTSVGVFFQTGAWTQCGTAAGCLPGGLDCCGDPGPCDVYGYLNTSLTYTKSFNQTIQGTYGASDVEAQVNMGWPVCVRVAWNGGGAHFLAMSGYSYPDDDPSAVTLYLQDSIYGDSSMAFGDFPALYNGGGTWTHTYLTQPNA